MSLEFEKHQPRTFYRKNTKELGVMRHLIGGLTKKLEVASDWSYPVHGIYEEEEDYERIFHREVKPLMNETQALFFSYGSKGSGKTHILFGDKMQQGLVQQAILASAGTEETSITILQMFKTGVYDLLTTLVENQD